MDDKKRKLIKTLLSDLSRIMEDVSSLHKSEPNQDDTPAEHLGEAVDYLHDAMRNMEQAIGEDLI